MRRILSRSTRSLTPLTRSHAPRGNAIFDAPRRARRDTPQSGKAAFPRGAWERVKAWERVNRAGFSLLEMFVAVVVFGTVLMTFLPLMQSVGNQQRITDQRLLALREANNLLEQLSVRQWSELSSDELVKISLPEDVRSRLPQAGMQIELSESAEQPPSKRVSVKVSWTPRSGQAAQSVQLAAWFFQTEGLR